MKLISLISFLVLLQNLGISQNAVDSISFNSIKLGQHISEFENNFYYISGNEAIYQRDSSLRNSILNNIKNEIREGIYRGNTLNTINQIPASKTTFFFYQGKLFKIRWDFRKSDFDEFEAVSKSLNSYLLKTLGKITGEEFGLMLFWEGRNNYLQSFADTDLFQIEFRNKDTHSIVTQLN